METIKMEHDTDNASPSKTDEQANEILKPIKGDDTK